MHKWTVLCWLYPRFLNKSFLSKRGFNQTFSKLGLSFLLRIGKKLGMSPNWVAKQSVDDGFFFCQLIEAASRELRSLILLHETIFVCYNYILKVCSIALYFPKFFWPRSKNEENWVLSCGLLICNLTTNFRIAAIQTGKNSTANFKFWGKLLFFRVFREKKAVTW